MSSHKVLLFLTTFAAGLAQVRISGPSLGYIFDPSAGAPRPIAGMPGSASILDPVGLNQRFERIYISPDHVYALAVEGDESWLVRLRAEPPAISILGYRMDQVWFGPSAEVAALYDQTARRFHVLSGLPDEPRLAATLDVSHLSARINTAALSDDASRMLVCAMEDNGATLWLVRVGGDSRPIHYGDSFASIAFFRNSHRALAADRGSVLLFDGSTSLTHWLGQADGLTEPSALGISWDNRRVVVADASVPALMVFNVDDRASTRVPTPRTVRGLDRARGNFVFLLGGLWEEPSLVFDGDAADARVFMVPRLAAPEAERGIRRLDR